MKALTVRQPWAWAIAKGHKTVENRGWTTNYRGPLAIHAAKAWDDDAARATVFCRDTVRAAGGQLPERLADDLPWSGSGAVIAIVDLVDICTTALDDPVDRCGCGPWAQPLETHWQLANVRLLPSPVETKGRLGLWNWDGDQSGE